MNIISLKGVGEKTASTFEKAGIRTISQLLQYYPRTYEIYGNPTPISELEEGKVETITGSLCGVIKLSGTANRQVTTVMIRDITGVLKVIWFRMPFLKRTLAGGGVITLRGRIVRKRDGYVMEHPEIFYPSAKYEQKRNSLQPVYALTTNLTNNMVIKLMKQAMAYIDREKSFLPIRMEQQYTLMDRMSAIRGIHFPNSKEEFYAARERLVFEEFLIFVLSLQQVKTREDKTANPFAFKRISEITTFIEKLPYQLTDAQKKVWNEIQQDMLGPHLMSRLVQGDVGSGKTIVALLGLFFVGYQGKQSAMMAPTEVLAKQHYDTIRKIVEQYEIPLKVELLTGSMTSKERRMAYQRIASGEIQIIVGTHALIQEKVIYKELALVVTDEQHRFGVRQREALAGKGRGVHILVMSATPIPRTLAIILYGDLDISVIDELPQNRLPIKNCVVDIGYRKTAYQFIEKQVKEGRQCYVICPMVEESESMEAENVTDYTELLRESMGEAAQIACLHGKMKQTQKDEIMNAFGRNEIQVLVATTVIEVGIDVPNATVILIENAERFGLAQLHQLRGRVGRGIHQSYCVFMSASKSKETRERLEILNSSNDGFRIASEDLRLRGPGDLFGIRQSGLLDFRLGDIFQDAKLLQKANEAANDLLCEDPYLSKTEHKPLKQKLNAYLSEIMLETTL